MITAEDFARQVVEDYRRATGLQNPPAFKVFGDEDSGFSITLAVTVFRRSAPEVLGLMTYQNDLTARSRLADEKVESETKASLLAAEKILLEARVAELEAELAAAQQKLAEAQKPAEGS